MTDLELNLMRKLAEGCGHATFAKCVNDLNETYWEYRKLKEQLDVLQSKMDNMFNEARHLRNYVSTSAAVKAEREANIKLFNAFIKRAENRGIHQDDLDELLAAIRARQ